MRTDVEVYGNLAMEVDEALIEIRASGKDFSIYVPNIGFAWLLLRRLSKHDCSSLLNFLVTLCESNRFRLVLKTKYFGGFTVLPAGLLFRLLFPALRSQVRRVRIAV
jgi:hypothetical protein